MLTDDCPATCLAVSGRPGQLRCSSMSRPGTIGRQIPYGDRPPVLVVGLSSLSGPFPNLSVAGLEILPLPAQAAAHRQCVVSGSPPRTGCAVRPPQTRPLRRLPLDSRGSSRGRQVLRVRHCAAAVVSCCRICTSGEGSVKLSFPRTRDAYERYERHAAGGRGHGGAADIALLRGDLREVWQSLPIARQTFRVATGGIGLSLIAMLFAAPGYLPRWPARSCRKASTTW
jgi:hypothetical protein